MISQEKLILASASPRRLSLLAQIQITPGSVHPANIDETPLNNELPRDHAVRLAVEKAQKIVEKNPDCFVLGADTVVACGRRILPKAETRDQAENCLTMLSGRRHHVYGGIALITPDGKVHKRLVDTTVKFKRLTENEIRAYLETGEWKGKAGGYAIQGYAEAFISFLQGSYSNVVGLSLYDTMRMLNGVGFTQPEA